LYFINTLTISEIDAINKFVLYNVEATKPWVELYEEKRRKTDNDMEEYKWLNSRHMPYHNHLK